MTLDVGYKEQAIQVFEMDSEGKPAKELAFSVTGATEELDEEQHQKILEYLMYRIKQGNEKRIPRIQRFARIDQMISTWQKLSPEDTVRQAREDSTGKLQALPINLPLTQAHIEDAVAFFTEVFAPVGGSFFATPGKRDKTEQVKALTQKLEQDMKQSSYYSAVASAMSAECKYNVGGFLVEWQKKSRLNESDGNVLKALDMYNFLYDPSILDVTKLHSDGEWCATLEVKNRLWLIRESMKIDGGFQNLENIFNETMPCSTENQKLNNYEYGKAAYYKNPPMQTRMRESGEDGTSVRGEVDDNGVDWEGYGLGLGDGSTVAIEGYEVMTIYAWINPEQFDLNRQSENENFLELYRFRIVDGNWIIEARPAEQQFELPCYMTRLKNDEMNEAMRSLAELIRPFQRFMSFLINTHVEGVRKAVWGLGVYDPTKIDITPLKNGETSGWLAMKTSGDARLALQKQDSRLDTVQNLQTAGEMMNLLKTLFPNQAAPSQIAGMDRAVTSQVSAVLQGAMRRMHMLVRAMDSSLMLPVRMAMYRNVATLDPDKQSLAGITNEEVAELLASGLGQINREAAAEQIRTLIFAIIQNAEANQGYDVPGLLQLWSILMNVGTDLSEFYKQPAAGVTPPMPADPNAPAQSQSGVNGITGMPVM